MTVLIISWLFWISLLLSFNIYNTSKKLDEIKKIIEKT